MGFNLRGFLEEKFADANPFDNGKTGATIRASRSKVPPAQTITKPKLQMGTIKPQTLSMGTVKPRTLSMGAVKTPNIIAPPARKDDYTKAPTIDTRAKSIQQGINQKQSLDQISNRTGLTKQELSDYTNMYAKGYGAQKPWEAVGSFIGDTVHSAAGIVRKPITTTMTANDPNAKKAINNALIALNNNYKSGVISNAKLREETNKLVGDQIGSGVVVDENGIRQGGRQEQSKQSLLGGFQQGIDTSNVLPIGNVARGAQFAKGVTSNLVKDIVATNAKQALVLGTTSTANDLVQGRGVSPTSLAMNYGAPALLGSASELAGGVAGKVTTGLVKKTKDIMSAPINTPSQAGSLNIGRVVDDVKGKLSGRPTNLTDDELWSAHKVTRQNSGWGDQGLTTEDMINFRNAEEKLGKQPGTPDGMQAVNNALDAHRDWNTKRQIAQTGSVKIPDSEFGSRNVDAPQVTKTAITTKLDIHDAIGNEQFGTIRATRGGKEVGKMDISITDNGDIHVNMIEVPENLRRQGIATELFKKAQQESKSGYVNPTNTTELGSKTISSLEKQGIIKSRPTPKVTKPTPFTAQEWNSVSEMPDTPQKNALIEKMNRYDNDALSWRGDKTLSKPTITTPAPQVTKTDTWYHGTNNKFSKFDPKKIGSTTDDGLYGRGVYFSNDSAYARQAPKGNGAKYVMEANPGVDNPLDLSKFKTKQELADYLDMSPDALTQDKGGFVRPLNSQIDQFTSHAKDMGHDGVHVPYSKIGAKADELVAFDTNKIQVNTPTPIVTKTPNPLQPLDTTPAVVKRVSGANLAEPKVTKEIAKSREGNLKPEDNKLRAVGNASTYTHLNTNRIDLSKEAKNRIAKETAEVVKKLSNDEVKDMAKKAGIDFKSYGVDGTRKKITEQLNVRNEIFTVEKQIEAARKAGNKDLQVELMQKSAELGRISRSQGTDLGRQLQARRIIADSLATPQQKLYRLFDEAGVDPEVYIKRMADVDMTKPAEVVKAYRELVPAKFGDWLDKYRYTNMLSSPLTHIVNISSNISGLSGVAPVQKLVEGAIDATRSAVTGAPRTRFASEAGSYLSGVAKSLPEATRKFSDVMTGKQSIDMPDVDALKYGKLADGGALGVADTVFSFIPKLLEASDQFGMTLVKAGEKAGLQKRMTKGVAVAKDITGLVEDKAKYRVFRQELNASGQGHLLDAVDFIPSMLLQARNSKNKTVSTIAKFTVPFVTTPTNLFKQGIEYSPAGVLTLSGNSDKIAQLAKMTMGTSVMAVAAATLASQDAISFSEPSDAKQRDAFRAEGKQPYSIKVGDKWIQYSKLHPAIAFNLALVGGTKDALDKGAIDQPTADKLLAVGGGILGFFRDQSYMKSIGDFTSALEMKDGAQLEDTIATLGGNWSNQLVPFKSMISWIGRAVDPTQRKIDYSADALTQIYQNMVKDIPGLNKDVPVRENPYTGEPIKNDNPILNSFSPLRVANDKGYGNTTGLTMNQRVIMNQMPDAPYKTEFRQSVINDKATAVNDKKELETLNKSNTSGATTTKSGKVAYQDAEGTWKLADNQDKADVAIASAKKTKALDEFDKSGKNYEVKDGLVYRRDAQGKPSVTTKIKYDYQVNTETMTQQKKNDNLDGWMKTAESQINSIDKQLKDKNIDPLDKIQLENDRQTIIDNATKYSGYGGFTKAGGSKTGKSKKGKFDYKLFGFSESSNSDSKDLYDMLSKVMNKRK